MYIEVTSMSEVVLLFNLVLKLTLVATPSELVAIFKGLDTLNDSLSLPVVDQLES